MLVVGAGIAGLVITALLRRQNAEVTLIERATDFRHAGYGVGIYPIGLRVLQRLGLQDALFRSGVPYQTYTLHDAAGASIERFEVPALFGRLGPVLGIRRPDLINVLLRGIDDLPIRFGTTVSALEDEGDVVNIALSDGTSADFHLVIGADGASSATRSSILPPEAFALSNTGWGSCYLVGEIDGSESGAVDEYYGRGHVLGIYPVRDGWLFCIGAPLERLRGMTGNDIAAYLRARWDPSVAKVRLMAAAFESGDVPFYAELRDCRCESWVTGRVALVGDAACTFLPTAGFGSTMAVLAASSLADELSRANARTLLAALDRYEQRQKPFSEKAQEQSRMLAKTMFVADRRAASADARTDTYTPQRFALDACEMMKEWVRAAPRQTTA